MQKKGWKLAEKADINHVDDSILHKTSFKLFGKENWKLLLKDGGVYKGKGDQPYMYSIAVAEVSEVVVWGHDKHDGFLMKGDGNLCSGI